MVVTVMSAERTSLAVSLRVSDVQNKGVCVDVHRGDGQVTSILANMEVSEVIERPLKGPNLARYHLGGKADSTFSSGISVMWL